MPIFRCYHLGGLLSKRYLSCLTCEATVRLSGHRLPREAPGGTTTVVTASAGALDSVPTVPTGLLVCRGLDGWGRGC